MDPERAGVEEPRRSDHEIVQGGETVISQTEITSRASITSRSKIASRSMVSRLTSLEAKSSVVSGMTLHGQKALSRSTILQLAYQSIGVVYGDIGTSPLYVYMSTFPGGLDPVHYTTQVLGALSLIIYTLTLIPLIKYVCIVLWANDNGDGGTFALYSLICRGANVSLLPNQQVEDRDLSSYKVKVHGRQLKRAMTLKNSLEDSYFSKISLLLMALLGTCMVIGDGVLTPAISVMSAVSGIQAATSKLQQNVVVILSIVILVLLFSVQRYGTARVGFVFAPVVLMWFVCIGSIGVYNIIKHDHAIFKAFNPKCIYDYFYADPKHAWISLGGIVLCITGAEAMFADLGHFSVPSIQIAFGFIVYPCCLLAYMGQAAFLMHHPEEVADTFYKSIPAPFYWPMFVIALGAAVIASQAMISATFAIVKQSMALYCFPTLTIVHTSDKVAGQIYVPEVNWILMIAAIIITAVFQSTDKLGNAYGIAVVGVMVVTTAFLVVIMIMIWQTPLFSVLAFLVVFGFIDALYFSSVLFKFNQGGYVPLAFAAVLVFIMYVWHYGTSRKHNYELENQMSEPEAQEIMMTTTRVPGIALFYSGLASGIPSIFSHTVKNLPALHATVVFVCIKYLPVTTVTDDERFIFRRVGQRDIHLFRCVARYGYKDVRLESDHFEQQLLENLKDFIICETYSSTSNVLTHSYTSSNGTTSEMNDSTKTAMLRKQYENGFAEDRPADVTVQKDVTGIDSDLANPSGTDLEESSSEGTTIATDATRNELAFIDQCKDAGVVYFLATSHVRAGESSSSVKRIVLNHVYNWLRRNCRKTSSAMNVPQERLLEVGMTCEV